MVKWDEDEFKMDLQWSDSGMSVRVQRGYDVFSSVSLQQKLTVLEEAVWRVYSKITLKTQTVLFFAFSS